MTSTAAEPLTDRVARLRRSAHRIRHHSIDMAETQGQVDVAVLHVPTIKPLDRHAIVRAASTDRLVLTCENHTTVGGLGEAVASTIALAGISARIGLVGLPDGFPGAGALPTLHERYGLSVDALVARIRKDLS